MPGKSIPNPSFLDECILLGAFSGEKRWKSKDGSRLYTWDALHGEIEVFNKRGKHLGVLDPYGKLIKPAKRGRKLMSDFIKDCLSGNAVLSEIDDYIDVWHEGNSPQELYQFLGMTEKEYSLFVTSADFLPMIIAAHQENAAFSVKKVY